MKFSLKIIIIITIIAINSVAYSKNPPKNTTEDTTTPEVKLNVTASIIPIASLVFLVTQDVQKSPSIILNNSNASPHDSVINYAEVKTIKNSSIIFMVSKNFEQEIVKHIPTTTKVVYLDESLSVPLDNFNELSYKLASAEENEHSHDHSHSHDHDHSHGHEPIVKDYHIWLDTNKAQQILYVIANELASLDEKNKDTYLSNAKKYSLEIQSLQAEIQQNLASLSGNFMVYHNAWGYFIKQNNLAKNYKGSIIANEADHSHVDTNLSAKNVILLSKYLLSENVSCVLLEPQFEDKTVETIIKKNNLKTAIFDPIGAENKDLGKNYFEMMKKNTQQLKSCV